MCENMHFTAVPFNMPRLQKKGDLMIQQENKMGVMKVNRLLVSMSLPMMASMLVQALYNIVDSIFVSHYDADALTAVSLTFPVQSLMIAIATGTGVGINSLVSRRLGEGRFKDANKTAVHGMFLEFLSSVVFVIIGLVFSKSFFKAFTSDPEVIEFGRQYMLICCVFSMGIFMQIAGERLLQSTGKTMYNMITQGCGALVNIILDPILIFGMFGLPEMGIAGAAAATVIGQWVAMILALYFNAAKNKEISVSIRGFKPDGRITAEIYAIAVPSIIMQSIMSISTVGMNKILDNDTAISVFGVYFKLQSFVFMPVFGLTNALIPIAAYNYGAGKLGRMKEAVRIALAITVGLMGTGTLLFEVFPAEFLEMFKADENMLKIGIPALRIIASSFCFSGVSIICASYFQALGKAVWSMLISIIRQLVVLLPAAFVLMMIGGLDIVWTALPAAEVFAMILSTVLYRKISKRVMAGA
jgi:putative MATE family efflux protein